MYFTESSLLVCIVLLVVASTCSFASANVEATDGTVVAVDPVINAFNASTTPVGSTFVVNATLANVTNLWMWQVNISFNPSMIHCVSAVIPSDSPFNFVVQPPPQINNVTGFVMLGACRLDSVGVDGNGVLATVTFKIVSALTMPGSSLACNLTLDPVDTCLWNPDLDSIPCTLVDGYYEYVSPPSDVAILNVVSSKTVIGQGCNASISVTIQNQGIYTETINVTVYVNTTIIFKRSNITVSGRNSTILAFTLNTSSLTKGNYSIGAHVDPLPTETDTADNTFFDGMIYVGIPGDVNADGKVDMKDIDIICAAYGSYPGHPKWNSNMNINDDGKVDLKDVAYACKHYGE